MYGVYLENGDYIGFFLYGPMSSPTPFYIPVFGQHVSQGYIPTKPMYFYAGIWDCTSGIQVTHGVTTAQDLSWEIIQMAIQWISYSALPAARSRLFAGEGAIPKPQTAIFAIGLLDLPLRRIALP